MIETGKAVLIDDIPTRFGLLSGEPGTITPHAALVLPIAKSGQEGLYGFLVMGISPRLALDEEYRGFFELIARQIATNIAHIRAYSARLEASHMRANIERQQAQRLQKLTQETIQARNEFISMISHDLKNPLGAIKGYAQLLERMFRRLELEPSIASRMASSLAGIDATVQRMTMLVNELLDLAHLQAGRQIQLTYQSADLIAIIRQVLAEQQQTARKHRLRIETTLEELRGSFDVIRMGRVIANLISNAIKYSPKESEIIVRVSQGADPDLHGPYAIIAVQDHGMGIPARDLPHVFEQFHRGENVVGKIPGTGLGLASVRHILERHGGTVSVTSEEGTGSTFTIRLPL